MHGSQLGRCSRSFGKGSAVRMMPDERGIYECSVDVYSMPTSTRDVSIVARKLEAGSFKVREWGPDAVGFAAEARALSAVPRHQR